MEITMNTEKYFLLSYDFYLFLGMRSRLKNLILIDILTPIAKTQQLLKKSDSCLLIIDNRLPVTYVNEWLLLNSIHFIHIDALILQMSTSDYINRGYENLDYVDANISTDTLITTVCQKLRNSLNDNINLPDLNIEKFFLTSFERDMIISSFTKKNLHIFCVKYDLSVKSLYRYRDRICTRFGLSNFNEAIMFILRNNLLTVRSFSNDNHQDNKYKSSYKDILSLAILNKEIKPYFQPVINQQGAISGVAIVAHWENGIDYDIPNSEIIPLADYFELTGELTSYLMELVVFDLSSLKISEAKNFFVSFKIGPSELSNPIFYWKCLKFLNAIKKTQIKLMIEVRNIKELNITLAVKELIHSLQNRGVLFSLNDFGTGYANLHYLNEFNFDVIKLDEVLVNEIQNENHNHPILKSIIYLAKNLHIRIIATGIKNSTQKRWLIKNDLSYLQGDYFSIPLGISEFRKKYM